MEGLIDLATMGYGKLYLPAFINSVIGSLIVWQLFGVAACFVLAVVCVFSDLWNDWRIMNTLHLELLESFSFMLVGGDKFYYGLIILLLVSYPLLALALLASFGFIPLLSHHPRYGYGYD